MEKTRGKYLIPTACVAVGLLLLVAFMRGGARPRPAGKPRVVATFSILGDWAQQIGGGDVEVTTLIGPDGDPHEYQPVPADSLRLAEASLIIQNGLGLEPWLDKLCQAAGATATRVVVTRNVTARQVPGSNGAIAADDDRDPHAWQDPRAAIAMVEILRDAIIKADPTHAEGYRSRAATYEKQLESLDADIAQQIATIPRSRRKLVTSHEAFGYYAQRYGIELPPSPLESVTTEAADPSARQVAEVIEQIKSSGVPVIFVENIQNPKLMQRIASEARVRIGPPLYSDALGAPGTEGDSYLKMMRYNTDALVKALK